MRENGDELVRLDADLRRLAREVPFPATPDFAARLQSAGWAGRSAAGRGRVGRARLPSLRSGLTGWLPRAGLPRAVALAIVAVAVAGGAAAAVGLGLRGFQILFVDSLPSPAGAHSPSPGGSPSATASAVGGTLGLGAPVTLDEARQRVAFPVVAPTLPEFSRPDAVYVGEPPEGGQVALVYAARPGLAESAAGRIGLVVTQFRGSTDENLVSKMIAPGTTVRTVVVGDVPGYWISGRPHAIVYRAEGGGEPRTVTRLAPNTLVWERDGVIVRIESLLTLAEALRIAESLR